MKRPSRAMTSAIIGAVVITVLFLVYLVLMAARGLALIGTGEPIAIALGIAVLILPILGLWFIGKEWWMAVWVQRMSDELAAVDALVRDDLPRSPGGRVDRVAANDAFAPVKAQVEADPDDWSGWFQLGFAYDAAGDRKRARATLRRAVALRRGKGIGGGTSLLDAAPEVAPEAAPDSVPGAATDAAPSAVPEAEPRP